MNCLCCGKPIKGPSESGWHKNCIKRFFGTTRIPDLDITDEILESLALESVNKGLTVPGVQKKLSLHLLSGSKDPRLTLVDYPTGYILKPQVKEYPHMPEAEYLVMTMADACGIATVPHGLVMKGDEVAYITKRVDRVLEGDKIIKLAMEDFCQLDQRLTQDKYKGSYERCAKAIEQYSSRKGLDLTELFIRLVFCFVTGNSDMHLKNFSLIETSAGAGKYVLSPAYDLLPVNLILPEDKEETALTLNGKKSNIQRRDFISFAKGCGIAEETASKLITYVTGKRSVLKLLCEESLLPDAMKNDFCELIDSRSDKLCEE